MNGFDAYRRNCQLIAQAMAPALEAVNRQNLAQAMAPALDAATRNQRLLAQAMAPALENARRNQRVLAEAISPALEAVRRNQRLVAQAMAPALDGATSNQRLLAQAMAPALEAVNRHNGLIADALVRSAQLPHNVWRLAQELSALQDAALGVGFDEALHRESYTAKLRSLYLHLPARHRRDLRDALVGLAAATAAYAWALCVAGRITSLIAMGTALYGLLRVHSAVVTAIEVLEELEEQ